MMAGNTEIKILDIPRNKEQQVEIIKLQQRFVIQGTAQQLKDGKQPDDAKLQDLYHRLDMLLDALERGDFQMTPEKKESTKIDAGLKLMFDDPRFRFPEEYQRRARDLYGNWEAERWGAGEQDEEEVDATNASASDSEPPVKRGKPNTVTSNQGADKGVRALRLPSPSHRIFGTDGIMNGTVAKKSSGNRKDYVLNPTLPKRNAKTYGNNGLSNGAWWPYQLLALFHGAHGEKQAGISGNRDEGAYSIVVSGLYDKLDHDRGEELWYSGSGSHDNEDPNSPPPPTKGTLALRSSLASKRPVRVLRSSNGKTAWAPTKGYRYDGLYTVVETRHGKNSRGGLFEQFRLVRNGGQGGIQKFVPNGGQLQDFERIQYGY